MHIDCLNTKSGSRVHISICQDGCNNIIHPTCFYAMWHCHSLTKKWHLSALFLKLAFVTHFYRTECDRSDAAWLPDQGASFWICYSSPLAQGYIHTYSWERKGHVLLSSSLKKLGFWMPSLRTPPFWTQSPCCEEAQAAWRGCMYELWSQLSLVSSLLSPHAPCVNEEALRWLHSLAVWATPRYLWEVFPSKALDVREQRQTVLSVSKFLTLRTVSITKWPWF